MLTPSIRNGIESVPGAYVWVYDQPSIRNGIERFPSLASLASGASAQVSGTELRDKLS